MRKSFWKRLRKVAQARRNSESVRKHRFCRVESLESRQLLAVTLPAIADQTVLAGAPLHLALNGSSSVGNPVAYTVSTSNPSLLTATVPTGNPSLKISVSSPANAIQGDMVFQLFEDIVPETVTQITTLADNGFYNGLIFHRVIKDFMVQGGDPLGTGTGGPGYQFDDEFDPHLQFTSAGILAMANSGADTNGSQFFITTVPTRWLDFNHTIFGFLTQGRNVLTQIENVPTNINDRPLNDVVMTSVSTITDTRNGVLRLAAPHGTTGSATVTVTARDTVTNETAVRTFQVTVQADPTNNTPFIWGTIDPQFTTVNTPVTFDIPGHDVEGDPIFYSGSVLSGGGTLNVNSSTGEATFTPPAGATGLFKVVVNVGASSTSSGAALDSQTVSIYVANATGNTPPVLTAANPSLGRTPANAAKTFELNDSFINKGPGTTLIVDPDEESLDPGIALIGTTGTGVWEYSINDGATFQPVGTVSATSALLLSDTAQLRFTPSGVAGGTATITYRGWDMTSGAEGAKVDPTTGGANSAFSSATDTATLTILSTNNAPVLAPANPTLGSTDEDTAKTIDLTSFINNGAGTTTITDADTGAVLGGIAVVGTAGRGTWAYSTDGTTFTSMGTVSASSALLLPRTAKIRYTPDNANGETATITYRAWDATSGMAGGRVNLSGAGAAGGSTAFSSQTDTASLSVSSLNDAPVLVPANPSLGGALQGQAKTISLTGTFINNGAGTTTITDVDTGATIGGIALVGVVGPGVWEYSLDGTTFSPVGAVASTSALLLPKTAQLRYTPSAAVSENASITYRAWDTTTGTAGSKVDTSANGGTTAFSAATDTASLSVGTASISGYVYVDNNNDGLRTINGGTHFGLPGVVIKLFRKDSGGNWTEVAGKSPIMTGADGSYRFEGLEPAIYRVEQVQPADFLDGKDTLGQVGGVAYGTAGNDYFELECLADQNYTEYNFGERGLVPGKISLRSFLASAPPASEAIARLNSAPTVDLSKALPGTGRTTSYSAGGAAVAIAAADAEVRDANSPMLASMTITIGNRLDGDSETLAINTAGTSLTSSFANGVLTVRGVASPAVYEQALKTVRYSNSAASAQPGDRLISVVVNDGISDSEAAVAKVTVTADVTPPSGYTIAVGDSMVNATEAASTSFTFAGAEVGATYNYTVTSSGGGTPVTGSGTITSATQQVTGINVSTLPDGTLTYSVTLRDAAGNTGAAATATATLDKTAPSGYTIAVGDSLVNATEAASTSFTFAGAEVGATYNYTVTSSGGGTPVTGSGTIASATQQVTGINVSTLPDGTLTYSVTLRDAAGNTGTAATATATLDKTAPSGYTITADDGLINATEAASTSFTFAGAEVGATYNYTVISSGGGTPVTGSGTIASATQQVTGINVSTLPDGTLTYSVTLRDAAGNTGTAATATATLDKSAPTAAITPNGSAVSTAPIVFTLTFNEPVTGVDIGDLGAFGSVTGMLTVGNFQAVSSTVYTVNVTGMVSGEHVTLTLNAGGSAIQDAAGNALAANAVAAVTFDTTAPTAAITPNGTTVNTSPITFTVTFSEPVTGVSLGDLGAVGSVTGPLTVGNFQAVSSTVYTVNVTGMVSGEYVTLTLNAGGSAIQDAAGNALAANAVAAVTFDNVAPTAAITPNGTTVNTSPITFTLTFSEPVTGVSLGDLMAEGSLSGPLTVGNFQAVSSTVYTVDVSGMSSGEGVTLTLTAAGSAIQDAAGNLMVANAAAFVGFDTTAPTAAITPNGTTVNTSPITFTVTFSEPVTGVSLGDLGAVGSVTGPLTVGNLQTVSSTVYMVDVSGMASGETVTLTLTAAGSSIQDAAGNALATNAAATVTFDNVAPSGYTITADDGLINATEAASTSFTFAGAEVGAIYNYTVISSGGGTPVTGSGTIASATQQVTGINVSSLPNGTLTYSVTLTDAAGNTGTAATATATLDKAAPTATTTAVIVGSFIEFTMDFGEAVSGFDVGDLTATGTVSGALTLSDFTVISPSSYSVKASGMTAPEQVTLRSPTAGSFADLAGNPAAVDAVFKEFDWS